jgi:hypothetical protein
VVHNTLIIGEDYQHHFGFAVHLFPIRKRNSVVMIAAYLLGHKSRPIFDHQLLFFVNKFLSVSAHSNKSEVTDKLFPFCSCFSSCGVNLTETHLIPESSDSLTSAIRNLYHFSHFTNSQSSDILH